LGPIAASGVAAGGSGQLLQIEANFSHDKFVLDHRTGVCKQITPRPLA
jgi:hypothetical protein